MEVLGIVKVYCEGCNWVDGEIPHSNIRCNHKENMADTPFRKIYGLIRECNENNDCKLYEKDSG